MKKTGPLIVITLLALSACCTTAPLDNSKERSAIELCGAAANLQLTSITVLEKDSALIVKHEGNVNTKFGDLTPSLRASALRTNSHCIALQMGQIDGKQYDHLMSGETASLAQAEKSLTEAQLKAAVKEGYIQVADILRKAGVSNEAIEKLKQAIENGTPPKVDNDFPPSLLCTLDKPSKDVLSETSVSIQSLEKILSTLPESINNKLRENAKEERLISSPTTIYFPPTQSTLDNLAINSLQLMKSNISTKTIVSVVGSADTLGTPQKNNRISFERAQVVATWILKNSSIPPHHIIISSRGGTDQLSPMERNRSVTVSLFESN